MGNATSTNNKKTSRKDFIVEFQMDQMLYSCSKEWTVLQGQNKLRSSRRKRRLVRQYAVADKHKINLIRTWLFWVSQDLKKAFLVRLKVLIRSQSLAVLEKPNI
jgi:hypothetical protein